ncbi:MAG: DUF1559 domain-containing protein [Planctomycetaceae bacterium]|nr:DUF1559 domain-containing protein [Planctomycetaceae bacterium]
MHRKSWRQTLVEICAVATICALIFVPLYWKFQEARSAAKRVTCKAYIFQLGTYLLDYERTHGHFPPPVISGDDGRVMHSWRTEALRSPTDHFVRGYDFTQPWDSPKNLKFARENVPNFVQCPEVKQAATTNYLLVIGTGCFYSSTDDEPTMSQLEGGSARIPLLVESADSDILWTEPRDLEGACSADVHSLTGVSSVHEEGAVVLYLDPTNGDLVLGQH